MSRSHADPESKTSAGPTPLWARVAGPLITLSTLGGILALAGTPWRIANPVIVFLIPVVYSAYSGGLGPGLLSAALGLGFSVLYLSDPGQPLRYTAENLTRLLDAAVVAPAIAVMVGVLKRRELRRVAVDAAARAGERYRDLVEDIDGVVWEVDPSTEPFRFTFVSRRAESILGFPASRWLDDPGFWLERIHREDREPFLAFARETARGGPGGHLVYRAVAADGRTLWLRDRMHLAGSGEGARLRGVRFDITDQRLAEETLRGTLSLLTATLESTADGILVVDQTGKIVSHNRKFADMWRIPGAILASRDDERAIAFVLSQLKNPEVFLSKVRELYAQPETESFDVLEFTDGRVFERYSVPQRIDERSVGRVWSFRDVTERRRAEAALFESELQLRQSQKMEAIGRLAGGVAHDFNNLLTVILGYCEQLLEQLRPHDPLRRAAEEIQGSAERAAGLTRQLLAFSRKQMLEPRVLDLNATLAGTGHLLRRLIGEDIQLEVTPDPHLGHVLADEHQLQQVIMNLAINARDAMPRGGRLTLSTANIDLDDRHAYGRQPVPPGSYVVLTVSDTGVGMDTATQARLFEPFFTTKERGKGTGLGLATVYGIVKQTGGYIWVSSEPGQGTEFKIYLPRLLDADATIAAGPSRDRLPTGNETVLLVEDETMVRDLLRGMLERHGYQVLAARSAEAALDVARTHAGPLDLLVADVVMPGMGGPELAARLAPLHPGLRVLHISGYTDDEVLRRGVREGLTAFLQKPFTIESLLVKVREVLDTKQPA